ncbi:calcium/sodium antiporter [bacterium]|nr:calcium/sodium antiporter [bacterium]
MDILVQVLLLVGGIAGVALGASWLVDSASRIAARLGISELVIGLTVVAFGTSAPELAVSVLAALKGSGDISVGNVVGSNIVNVTIILGAIAMIRPFSTPHNIVKRDGPVMIIVSAVLGLMLFDASLGRLESVVLLAIFAAYLGYFFWKKEAPDDTTPVSPMRRFDPLLLLVSLGLVIGASHVMVDAAVTIASRAGVSQWVIGSTIVAFGTSVPEFATSLLAVLKKRNALSLGNLIGSNIFNIVFILGIAGTIHPLSVALSSRIDVAIMVGIAVVVFVMAVTSRRISRLEGAVLFLLGVAQWVWGYMR